MKTDKGMNITEKLRMYLAEEEGRIVLCLVKDDKTGHMTPAIRWGKMEKLIEIDEARRLGKGMIDTADLAEKHNKTLAYDDDRR